MLPVAVTIRVVVVLHAVKILRLLYTVAVSVVPGAVTVLTLVLLMVLAVVTVVTIQVVVIGERRRQLHA